MVTSNLLQYISSAGMESFYDHVPSDHRGLYIDADLGSFLQGHPKDIIPPARRGIRSKHPAATKKYLAALTKYWSDHSLEQRIKAFEELPTYCPHTYTVSEQIDRDIQRGLLHAEAACLHFNTSP